MLSTPQPTPISATYSTGANVLSVQFDGQLLEVQPLASPELVHVRVGASQWHGSSGFVVNGAQAEWEVDVPETATIAAGTVEYDGGDASLQGVSGNPVLPFTLPVTVI